MCTIIFNTIGDVAKPSYSIENLREWLQSVILVKEKNRVVELPLANSSIKNLLKNLKSSLEEEETVAIENRNWATVIENLFLFYLNEKISIKVKENEKPLNFVSGVGSNNLQLLSPESLEILSMKYWENPKNSNDIRIFVRVRNNSNLVESEYYIHKNLNRYNKKEHREEISQYHLGDMAEKELSFTGCSTVEEMFEKKGKW